jgi:superfamily II DNA/RNA helicase
MGMSKKVVSELPQITLSEAVVAQEKTSGEKKQKKRKEVAESAEPTIEKAETKKRKTNEAEATLPDAAEAKVPGAMDVAAYRAQMQIKVTNGVDVPDPVQSFDEAPFGKKMRNALKEAGFAAPSAVQAQAWPLAVKGGDLVSVAKTGSGKTLAFLLPAFRKINKEKLDGSAGPVALVLAPTRELATQIEEVAVKFGVCVDVKTTIVFGGVPKPPQQKALKAGPQLVVATPGRLMDLMEDGSVKLGSVQFLVLDEADRMLDMGFEPQMEKIMKRIPAERQTLLFSATWPKGVQKLTKNYLKSDAVHVNVGETEELAANKAVSQEFVKLGDDEKDAKLHRILYDMGEKTKIIIFANTKNRINNLQKTVWGFGYDCVAMHGDKAQWERDAGLEKFKSGEISVMMATDVCARGLDIKDVTHVLNFDMARDVESYIHRIGRTGRAGKEGKSITFFNDAYDLECAPALAKIAKEAGQEVPAFLEKAAEKGANTKNKLWKY